MRDTSEEQWRPIEGYERMYEVSNLGRVRSSDSYNRLGRLHLKGRILRPKIEPNGYLRATLFKEGKRKVFMIHRLVAQAFIPNPEGLPQINHIDEDKTNNRVENLEWCDGKYNMNYGTRTERGTKNSLQTKISKGLVDPEMCGIRTKDRNEYARMWYKKNREKRLEYQREYRLKKKQEKKNNRPSETSLW